jgi:hypothetical protein
VPRDRGPSHELIEDDAAEPLPAGTYAAALDIHLGMQRTRTERLYNRTRAIFAESIVAALLPGAVLVEDPAAAWDVSWQPSLRSRPIRIRSSVPVSVCLGDRAVALPQSGTSIRRRGALTPRRGSRFRPGYCDLLVLARHRGQDVAGGWSFFVMRPDGIQRSRRVTPQHLAATGAAQCGPVTLAEVVRRVAAGRPT